MARGRAANMSSEHAHGRRGSLAQTSQSISIPHAPNLPSHRGILEPKPRQPLQRARDAASKFLGYTPSRPPSAHGDRDEDRYAQGSAQFKRHPSLSIAQDATTSHRTGLEINTIAINETGTHALIGGKGIFKTIKVEEGHCNEDLNLRTTILSSPRNASGAPRDIWQIDIADVAWAKGEHGDYVVAATSSGKIILYNLRIAGLQAALLYEHSRQVHKVTFNPHRGNLLLSGSQDGTVRLWDLRDVKAQASALHSKRKFAGQADGVRDVKWSPTEGLEFACGTDSGDVQCWDLRNLKSPKAKISAHLLACNSIDWHPDGKHLMSASSDRSVRVFDFSVNRPKNASWEIKTPYPVMNARWRPSCESSVLADNGARMCTQFITSYSTDHPAMQLWDLRRPYLPFRELAPYRTWAPTDLLWHSQDLLWTVGREGVFLQTDMQYVPKLIDRRNLQALDVSPLNELSFSTQVRTTRRMPVSVKQALKTKTSSSLSISPDSGFLSRSWADDTLDHVFLALESQHRPLVRSDSNSRAQGANFQPGSTNSDRREIRTIKLDDVLLNRKSFQPKQIACRGTVPGPGQRNLAAVSAMQDLMMRSSAKSIEDVSSRALRAIENNIQAAQRIGSYRLSQTWQIVWQTLESHLRQRTKLRDEVLAGGEHRYHSHRREALHVSRLAARLAAHYLKSPTHSPTSMHPVPSIIQQLAQPESSSNVPTPLARPTTTSRPNGYETLPDPIEEHITLPPSLARTHSAFEQFSFSKQHPGDHPEQRLTADNLSGLQLQQEDEQAADRIDMVRRWSAQPRVPLHLDDAELRGMQTPPDLEKHDSDESFKFLEGSLDSRNTMFPDSLSSAASQIQMVAEHPSRKLESEVKENGQEEESVAQSQHMAFEGSGTLAESSINDLAGTGNSFGSKQEAAGQWSPELSLSNGSRKGVPEQASSSARPEPSSDTGPTPAPSIPEIYASSEPDAGSTTANNVTRPATSRAPQMFDSNASLMDIGPEPASMRSLQYIDIEGSKPWTLLEMLQQLIRFYTVDEPIPQAVSMLLLIVAPLMPLTHPLPAAEIETSVRVYLEYAVDHLNLEFDDVYRWFSACDFERAMHAGLHPLQIEGILSTYHEQLLSRRCFSEASELRKLAFPAYPALYEDFIRDNVIHFKCSNCNKPIAPGRTTTQCEKCRVKRTACTVCWMPRSPWVTAPLNQLGLDPDTSEQHHVHQAKLYTACLACGHSGHADCYRFWFLQSGGTGCPTEGCLCTCTYNIHR